MQRQLQEVVVVSAGPSGLGQGAGTIALYDIHTGTSLFTLKQSLAGPKCSLATQTRDGQGGLVLAAQLDKAILNVYNYQKVRLGRVWLAFLGFKSEISYSPFRINFTSELFYPKSSSALRSIISLRVSRSAWKIRVGKCCLPP